MNRAKHSIQSLTSFAAILLILLVAGIAAHGQQEQQYTQNKSDQTLRSDIRVDPVTHSLGIQIPIASYPGRAGNKVPVTLYYSSKVWRIEFDDIYFPPSGSGAPRAQSNAKYAEQSVAGWTTSLDVPTIEFTFRLQSYDLTSTNYGQDGGPLGWRGFIARIHAHLPDGSTHELRKDDAPHNWGTESNYGYTGTYYSVDGSRMKFVFDPGVRSGVLFMPDGGRYTFPDPQGLGTSQANQYVDRNGNTLTYNSTTKQWTDSVGRLLGSPLPAAAGMGGSLTPRDVQYSVPGMGTSSLNYTFKWRYLSDPTTGETVLSNPDPDPNNRLYYPGSHKCTWPSQALTPRMFANAGSSLICASTKFNRVVLAEIVLPHNTSYRFRYNPWGEIDTIYLPSGGYERFAYNKIAALTYLKAPYDQGNRAVSDRWLSSDGTAASESHWQYGIEYTIATDGPYVATCTQPDGTIDKLYLHSHPNNYGSVYKSVPFGMDDSRTGSAYEERVYSSGGTLLRRKLVEWAVTPSTVTTGPPGPYGDRNPRIAKEVEILFEPVTGGALAKTVSREYDTSNQFTTGVNETAVTEFDFVVMDQATASSIPIGSFATGTALRRTEKTFLETTNQAYRDRHLLGLVNSLAIRDMTRNLPTGVVVAQSSNSYDETGLLTCGATNWIDPNTSTRGNLTSTSRWLNFNGSTLSTFPSGSYLTTRQQYDQCGSVRVATDANGNQSQIFYSSSFNYAFPTSTTTAVPDVTGGHSLNQSLTSSTDYDLNTGLVLSTTNANGQLTTMVYSDSLYRLTQVTKPDGGHITYSYSDITGDLYVRILTDLDVSRSTETRQYFDGLGRSTRKFIYQGKAGAPWTVTDTYYDNIGRAAKVSNPYETATPSGVVPGTCSACTVNTYDALGRVVSVTTPEGAHVDTAYSGSRVLVTDQAGKQRLNQTDALGRTSDIWEITGSDQWTESVSFPNHGEVVAGYRTHYNYDQLDNLVEVVQSSQPHRIFLYDSLKRLVRGRVPEQGTYGSDVTDPITGNSAWSLKYVYDSNGNLTQRTDARGIVSTYSYDALSRNTQVSYSDGTPRIDRYYDRATNGKGSLWYETTTNPGTGSLIDQREFVLYDLMGRPLTLRQLIANSGINYQYTTQRTYNQAGLVTSQTYPSGHVVNYNYDAAGRTSSLTGNLGDGVSHTYSTSIEYSPFGGLSREQFGTNTPLYRKSFYNIRGQLFDTRLSSVNDTWDWNRGRLILYYSSNHTWGQSGADNNGNVRFAETWIPPENAALDQADTLFEESYSYDSSNRVTSVAGQRMSVATGWGTWQQQFRQQFTYDRYGNRTIDAAQTWGTGINNKQFTVDAATNRLGVPSGQVGAMSYDTAGNLINDTYTGAGARVYDAEHRMISAWGGNNQWQEYTYNAAGQRTRRKVDSQQTWQIYGVDGELLAEYAVNGAAASPQKEYGYRNGQLLIAATPVSSSTQWVMSDHIGTPRMIVDQTGALANIKRHDYLPFGEELVAGVGGRTSAKGYGADGVRQQFTQKERDIETNLDYFGARYYSSTQGRFTGPDPLLSSGKPAHPQSWNRYTYCLNHPLVLVDANGLIWGFYTDAEGQGHYHWYNSPAELEAAGASVVTNFIYKSAYGTYVTLNPNAREYVQNIAYFDATRALWGYKGLEASWQDWVPVWGQFRRFMFNYATGNYEGALVNFGMASVDGGTMASGFLSGVGRQVVSEGGEQAVLRFSQTTASPFFSEEGTFAGKTIGQLAQELRSGAISPKDIPIHVVDGADGVKLIVNTRSSLALTRAGIPQSSWNIIDMSANQTFRTSIGERLFRNGLTNQGTDVLRITKMGKGASNLQ